MRQIPSKGYMYLASPYSHPDPFVREARTLWTMKELAGMLRQGLHVYSPIVHCHQLALLADLPKDNAFWREYNLIMLTAAETMGVLMLPGWQDSLGVADEIKSANTLRTTILYIEPKEKLL